MKLRVITATLGESKFWPESLASVAHAVSTADHVVVCPAARSPGLGGKTRLIAEQGAGLYPALNQGARDGADDWDAFTWLNDDDRLAAPGFGALLAAMSTEPDVGICYGRVELIDAQSARVGALPVARRPSDLPALLARGVVPFAQPGTVIRRSAWEKVRGFDESYRLAGDLDFFVRALNAGVKFKFVDATVASFRLSAGQLSKQDQEMELETARVLQCLTAKPRWPALWRFKVSNLGVYLERLRRHGWVSMRTLQQRVK
jgi:GT2 family glycosyltransferase